MTEPGLMVGDRYGGMCMAALLLSTMIARPVRVGAQQAVPAPAARWSSSTRTPGASPQSGMGDTSRDAIAAATREYQASGVARTVVQGDFISFPFGHSQPTLTCTVLRACVIELEPGEIVLSRILGDTERWEIAPAPSGPDGRTVLVVVKPRECDITTNLVLATDRRLYDLTLDSPPCAVRSTNPQHPYARHVRFYYPDEMLARWALPPAPAGPRVPPDVRSLDFGYRVKKDRQFPWTPAQVFDDGARVYIKLPREARHAEAPVLFVLESDGARVLINYSLVGGDTYVTDRLFDQAVLVAGVGGKERRVVIERSATAEGALRIPRSP